MNKLLPLVCLSLLPLSAFALLENATVSATVLPSENDEWVAANKRITAELTTHTEAQLAKMPALSGMYMGLIRVEAGDEPKVLFFRMVSLGEGENKYSVADDKGVLTVDATLMAEGHHWSYKGFVGYREYVAPERVFSSNTTLTVAEGLTVISGMSSNELRRRMSEQGLQPVNDPTEEEYRVDTFGGFFMLRTADTPDPKLSPANPMNRVTLPSGRVVQLEPGLSREAAREVLAAEMAKEAAAADAKPAAK